MAYEAKESDWKLFRKRIVGWQERYMQSLLDEYAGIIASDAQPSTRFWELERRLKQDVRCVGVQATMSRSTMFLNLLRLLNEKAISMADLEDFSDELRRTIDEILRYNANRNVKGNRKR